MQAFAVIVENDESKWQDDTGVLYHFPRRYRELLAPGTRVVYYKGRLKDRAYSADRLSDEPHYFGVATIGRVFADRESEKGDLFATVDNYETFAKPVIAKQGESYLEPIPPNRATNYWRDGVRAISRETFEVIAGDAAFTAPTAAGAAADQSNEAIEFESGVEGSKVLRFVATYERNARLRRQAIAIHGLACACCGFDFGRAYGEYAAGLIHVHHVVPVSTLGGAMEVDPSTDLVPVCANCHLVIHRRRDATKSIAEVREMLETHRVLAPHH